MPEVVSIADNVCIDVVDTDYERRKQCLNRLLGEDTELIIGVQPATFFTLVAGLADRLVGAEKLVHWAIPQIHAGHHQHPWIGEGFNDSPSHVCLRQRPTSRQDSGGLQPWKSWMLLRLFRCGGRK